ncbi:MAG: ribosome silencing factor [Myxococcales bacterium]
MAAKKSTRPSAAATKKKAAPKAKKNPARDLALAIAEAALDKKALQVEIIEVSDKVDYADYVVVMSATSDRHANALAKNVDAEMARKGIHANSIEGLPQGAWVLMDFGDVVVHIFHEDTRGYYDLEALWYDAARVPVSDKPRAP